MDKQILLTKIYDYINTTEDFLEKKASAVTGDIINIIGGMEE